MLVQQIMINLKGAYAGAFNRPAHLIWFVAAAVVTPFALLVFGGAESNNLPWYIWVMGLLLLLTAVGVAFLRFTHKQRESDLSITPKSR